MTWIQSCLQAAQDRKAQEVLIQAHRPVHFRVGRDLVAFSSPAAVAQDARQVLSQILNDEERRMLYENLKVSGSKTIGSVSFKFDFQIDFEGVNGSLALQNDQARLWNLPSMVTENICRSSGLNVVVGPRRSGKTAALNGLLESAQGRKKVIAIYTEDENAQFASEGNFLCRFPLHQLQQNDVMASADLVVIDSRQPRFCEKALALSEEGRSVVLTLPYWDLQMGLQRLMDLVEGSEAVRARRLAATLQMALGLKLLPGLETQLQGAFELMFVDAAIQSAITQMQIVEIPQLMKSHSERTGMRSLNQSLFQLLMKRKIELKAAFEASSEPEELDSMLKKVGI